MTPDASSGNGHAPGDRQGRSLPANFLPPDERGNVVWNEFAAVRVEIVRTGLTPRLKLTDLESGESTTLDPVELASFIITPDDRRADWLAVGPYSPP